ncbi:MAG: hypothetical protein HGA90_03335, partial [Alphaproteobacteria bacterium]|nr:hypothetical protein [Alphaproteobacteria bacterium]
FNVSLRLVTLASKLMLTLYMGRYLSLGDLGSYGLVFGVVVLLPTLLGLRFDYVVSRDLVSANPLAAAHKIRDQAVFYTFNHLMFAGVMAGLAASGLTGVNNQILLYIFILATAENYATMVCVNMTSLGKPVLANFLFFVRSGSWALLAMLLGLVNPVFRNVETILLFWAGGVVASLLIALWLWRSLPWRQACAQPIDWTWIKAGVKRCLFIWLGTVGIASGIYVDRFAVMRYLGLDYVGITTFYFSFANALFTLVQSGVLSLVYPRLILLHRDANVGGFWSVVRQTGLQVALFAGVVGLGIALAVPFLGQLFKRPELVAEVATLWLMLGAVFLRANAETLYYVLFARHQDKPVWLGNLLFLVPAFGGNFILVPLLGLKGIGVSAVASALFLLLWRGWYVWRYPQERSA